MRNLDKKNVHHQCNIMFSLDKIVISFFFSIIKHDDYKTNDFIRTVFRVLIIILNEIHVKCERTFHV